MATPSTIPVTNNLVHDYLSVFDIVKPDKLPELFRRYGDQGLSYYHLLKLLGFEMPVANDSYEHYEENKIHNVIHELTGFVHNPAGLPGWAPGGGDTLALPDSGYSTQIAGDAIITLNSTLDVAADLGNAIYVRVGDEIVFPNQEVGLVVNIDYTTYVVLVRPVVTGGDFGTIAAGQELAIVANAFSENSDQPNGRMSGVSKVTNQLQIIKEDMGTSGSAMADQSWFNKMSDGQSIPAWYLKLKTDMEFRFALSIDGALWASKKSTNANLIDPVTGLPYKTTEGLLPFIKAGGATYTYNKGNYQLADFDAYDTYLESQFVTSPYILSMLGTNLYKEIENRLVDFNKYTSVQYTKEMMTDQLFGGDNGKATVVNFKQFEKSGRCFLFKRIHNFNNPQTFGAANYPYINMGVLVPLDKTKDAKTGALTDSIGCRYKSFNGYDRKLAIWETGGAGNGIKTNGLDNRKFHMLTHMGAHHKGANRMIVIEPV